MSTAQATKDYNKAAQFHGAYVNWKIPQPHNNFKGDREAIVDQYLELAHAAKEIILQEEQEFLESRGLTYLVIPHEDFLRFELTQNLTYQEWLQEYCDHKNVVENANAKREKREPNLISPDVDIIMTARVKERDSILRKIDQKSTSDHRDVHPSEISDYVAVQYTVLKKTSAANDPRSIGTLWSLMAKLTLKQKEDNNTMGLKNQLSFPKLGRGFRAFKSKRRIVFPESHSLEGKEIDRELKIEH